MNVKKRKVEDMRRNLIVAVTLLLAACTAQPPAAPVRPADLRVTRKTGVQPLGQFTATVQPGGPGLHAFIGKFRDASGGLPNQNPVDTLEVFSDVAFTPTSNNQAGDCLGETTIGAPITLKNYTLDELRTVHVEISYVGVGSACSADFGPPPDGSTASPALGIYHYPDLVHGTATSADPTVVENLTAGEAVQWDFLELTASVTFTVRGQVYAERWPAMPVMSDSVQDVLTSTPTFHWTTDASVTRTLLVVYDRSCTTSQGSYDVDRTSTDGTSSFYSQVVPLAQDTLACADLYPIAYVGLGNQFVGTQVEREGLENYSPPLAGQPASGDIISPSFNFTWTASPDAASVTAYVCDGATATPADCVSTGTAFQVFGDGVSGSYTTTFPGLTAGPHQWTLVAADYLNAAVLPMTGTPTALKTFTVK
jgi:hypothetical protein